MMEECESQTFPKKERLCGKKSIDSLFSEGDVVLSYPFRICYSITQIEEVGEDGVVQVLFSVPKRNFKRAVHRNWLKRRIKESFRLRKKDWRKSIPNKEVKLAFLYIAKEKYDYAFLDEKMEKALKKIGNKINEAS